MTSESLLKAYYPSCEAILRLLTEHGPLSADEIAKRVDKPKEETSVYLGVLYQNGLLGGRLRRRRVNLEDVLSRYFKVTRKGEKLLAEASNLP